MQAFYIIVGIAITAMVFSENRKYGPWILALVVMSMLVVFKRKGGTI